MFGSPVGQCEKRTEREFEGNVTFDDQWMEQTVDGPMVGVLATQVNVCPVIFFKKVLTFYKIVF